MISGLAVGLGPGLDGVAPVPVFVNVYDGFAFSGPKEFHVNVPPNNAPTLGAPDLSVARGQVISASSLFSANDADGDSLLYFFYDNSSDPTSGHFTVNGVVQAAHMHLRGVGGATGADQLHGRDADLRRPVRERLRRR